MYSSASDKYPLNNMRQVFVHGQTPSQIHGASIRPWTNTLSKSWGKYSSMDEYLLKIMGQYSYCGRIPSQKGGASIRTVDEYPVRNVGQVFVRGRIAPMRRMDFPSIRQIFSYSCGVCNRVASSQPFHFLFFFFTFAMSSHVAIHFP